jgi:hypothetical protein
LLFRPITLFFQFIWAINAECKWRPILPSLFVVPLREVIGQEVKKGFVLDDHIAPERRVGELVGFGCKEQRHDVLFGALIVHDVWMSPVDA